MLYPVFTEQEFKAGLARLGEDDVRKLLRGGALNGAEAQWAAEWLACGAPAYEADQPVRNSVAIAA